MGLGEHANNGTKLIWLLFVLAGRRTLYRVLTRQRPGPFITIPACRVDWVITPPYTIKYRPIYSHLSLQRKRLRIK
jgi:hypothetical protein